MRPLIFSLGIRSLLRDLVSTLGPDRLIRAYLDDIYFLSPADLELEQTLAYFGERQPSIRLNPANCKMLGLSVLRTSGPFALGCWERARGAHRARERFSRRRPTMRPPPLPNSSTCPTATLSLS
jgi:hypothetical protein